MKNSHIPEKIIVRGARVHNLKNIDVDIPLHTVVGIAGVSGSGKSSLAIGVLYAEGSGRYLEALSAYTRRRLTLAQRPDVDEVLYVPPALALRQRPGIPDIRSTFGTGTGLLNSLRLMFSRLASHRCPNGHYCEPTLNVAAEKEIVCPVCETRFFGPSAEDLSFNSAGACERCGGAGSVWTVAESTLVPDESLTIAQGAVAPWNSLMWSLMTDVCREMGVRTDIPFRELTPRERDIVFHGPAQKKRILYKAKNSNTAGELDFTYYNAVYTVENALAKVKDEKGLKRVEKFLKRGVCPACDGSRLSEAARAPKIRDIGLDAATAMNLAHLYQWVADVPKSLPEAMRPLAESVCDSFRLAARRLRDLGLDYLTLDRAASSLSTGERQRMQLAKAARNRSTGALYVLDEPSIGLHPFNLEGVAGVMEDLLADGNSVILVDHEPALLRRSGWIIELGPGAGSHGGEIIAQGTPEEIRENRNSRIAHFLFAPPTRCREKTDPAKMFARGEIVIKTGPIHTVKALEARIPTGKLTLITGVSGSGKTTLILESLAAALKAEENGQALPGHVKSLKADDINRILLIDAAPIGINIRSTVATYANVHDELRKIFAKSTDAKTRGLKAGDFSYNTGKLRCPVCDGDGVISLDAQFLADVDIACPECGGSRYSRDAFAIRIKGADGEEFSLPELMAFDIKRALAVCRKWASVRSRLEILDKLGLGYLTLGEATPSLSGGEAQRLKLASEMGRDQSETLFIFDEPTIGLHPLDTENLIRVFQSLLDLGGTVVVIEHDLDAIANADYIIDMGPGGGEAGGEIVATGTPEEIAKNKRSVTGRYLNQ
ncbi:MAG: ATP-binding cassette domain-containing protein [Desulfovibrio sp.]|nr:ATP-binding cassette domain-containing protein [Desulfovibrio sp.]